MGYKKTFRYSTGNPIVDEVGTMNFTGNVIPMVWFKTIRYPNGAPHNNAIHILADIVYWYRPKEERDEESGQLIGMKKKFRDDYLQRSYDQMADTFGLSKKQATEAVKALEKMGIIKRIFKTIQVRGQILNNVLFIELIPQRLYEVTFPEEIEENTLSPPKEIPLSVEGERGSLEKREGTTSKVTGISLKGETNTKNTIENTNKDYRSINQGEADTDQMDMIEIYTQIVKENIDYEILKADMKYQYELLDELVEIIVDVVAVHRKSIRIGGADYPYELVKGKFLKLDSGHIRYVLDSMEKTTTHIANIKAYLLTALYNAPNTISNYYSAEVNYYEYGNGRNEV
ncbi:MAG: DNA replication protein DnaD [Lachnospiraceae bacterium]|jgi:DNA-binding Lrp family transcriptional regulator